VYGGVYAWWWIDTCQGGSVDGQTDEPSNWQLSGSLDFHFAEIVRDCSAVVDFAVCGLCVHLFAAQQQALLTLM
jgi:hypothetical protein